MNVLLINSPIRLDAPPSCIPYGLATIASTLKNAGHSIDIYDINAYRPSESAIIDTLERKCRENPWDVVGISGLITTYRFQTWLIPHLRRINPKAKIVQGGGLATSNPELCRADIAVRGEGELPMLAICNSEVVYIRSQQRLDDIPMPAWNLLPMDIYLNNPIWGDSAGNSSQLPGIKVKKSMNIIASRGCPFSCNYCYHLFGQGYYRIRSPKNVIAEVEALIGRYGVDFIGFVDDNMMVFKEWLSELCDLLKPLSINWGCHGRVASATPWLLDKMRSSGCRWIGYGIESGSQVILNRMNKNQTVKQARNAILDTRSADIFPNTTFIYGYPGETPVTVQETIDFKAGLNLKCGSFYATPYPGTVLYEQVKHKLPKDYIAKLGNAAEFVVNLTDMSDDLFFELKKKQDAC